MVIPNTPFFIVSKLNNRVLDVEGGSEKDGAKICVWTKKDNNDNSNQLWEYKNGSVVNVRSKKFLAIKGNDIKNDVHIVQKDQVTSGENTEIENQRWNFDQHGYIHIQSNPNFVIDIRGAKDKDGAEVILYEKREGTVASNQEWILEAK